MKDQQKLEIDRLYRTVNVLREAVTKLQQDKAQQQGEIDELRKWATGLVETLKQNYDHQKAEIDELYRCAEAAANNDAGVRNRMDKFFKLLTYTMCHADLALDKVYPRHLEFEEELAKIIGDPVWGKEPPTLPDDPVARAKL